MAIGAMFGFVVIGRDFEHVVALDANAVNFRLISRGLLRFVFDFCSLTHG
jgi:hypothetical protein